MTRYRYRNIKRSPLGMSRLGREDGWRATTHFVADKRSNPIGNH